MTTTALFIIFFPLALVILANACIVPSNPAMRTSTGMVGIGVLGASIYWGLRAAGVIEPSIPQYVDAYRVALILVAIGLYSVFGAPLFLEIVKRRGNSD